MNIILLLLLNEKNQDNSNHKRTSNCTVSNFIIQEKLISSLVSNRSNSIIYDYKLPRRTT